MQKIGAFCLSLVVLATLTACVPQPAEKFVTIGTGGVTGVYYPTGGAIARIVNQNKEEYGIRATVESTGGSVFNINAVLSGDLDFGIVQSDRQYQALEGLAEWEEQGPQTELRSVFSIHPEAVTLVAAADSGIRNLRDLRGKRVNIGNPGSGQRQNSLDALAAVGLSENDIKAEEVKAAEAPSLLQDGRIDAFFYTVGHPNGNIKEATSGKREARLVSLGDRPTKKLTRENSYYSSARIPVEHYPNAVNTGDVETFGVKATFVTAAAMDAEIVYAITKEVFENFAAFKKLHPAYAVLTKENMLEGLSAPIHPGALKYYQEAGLAEQIDPKLILE